MSLYCVLKELRRYDDREIMCVTDGMNVGERGPIDSNCGHSTTSTEVQTASCDNRQGARSLLGFTFQNCHSLSHRE